MRLLKYIMITSIIPLTACEDVPDYKVQSEPVIEAYLYEGDPVDDIILKKSSLYNEEDNDQTTYLTNANVHIILDSESYELSMMPGEAGRYEYTGDDLTIKIGETYRIEFEHEGETVHAETTIPPLPENGNISHDEIYIPLIDTPSELRDFTESFQETIDITWNNENDDYHYLLIENIEANPEPINQLEALAGIGENFEYVSSPTQSNIFSLRATVHYNQFGLHRVTLFHVNEEYAQLYETTSQDSRDLYEPFTNVKNGLGIFTGFSSVTFYFEVLKK
ncbi:DUF4249 family protein [Muricauda sp. 334s03]|uniref:DUF4249 family protein n=1 Tax=Flagellimonas yonaguniensis TaxID=3031325 RepID=A0ABT5XWR3_9FLAO|nr:DUF4249 family protein [[Muricauda] yonaguniensis]MDF0715623.1 DUF4249 family protein [[Muricauda] yonaguniensis]